MKYYSEKYKEGKSEIKQGEKECWGKIMKEEEGPPPHFMLDNCCPYFMDPIAFKWVFVLSPS